ncbi:hypothetical protein [uncultured Eubacterium sp.]|uniref:hypothetical protein n=1 Tax=uncultured Eubacterium sp. TaxID=165185 RepID=UPI003267DA4F
MIIELLGTPSCGKSTFANSVVKKTGAIAPLDIYLYNSSRIIQNCNKVRLSLFAFWFYNDKARCYNAIFNTIEFPSKTKKIKMWLYVFSVIGAIWKAKKNFPEKDLILDEGINQVIWGLLYNEINSTDSVWEFHRLLIPEMATKIVHFNIERDVLKERLLSRRKKGGSELEHEIKTDERVLDLSIGYINEIVEHIKQEGYGDQIWEYYGGEVKQIESILFN